MSDLHEVFQRLAETKKERKKFRDLYQDGLKNSKAYQEVVDKLKELVDKKKQIEQAIRQEYRKELEKMDDLAADIKSDNVLLADLAVNTLMKGETVAIKDENDTEYEPIFSVKFKKAR